MRLSLRLQAVSDLTVPGHVLADIGTDHAYLPIDLIKRGRIPHAIAMDIHPGPLARAQAHIQREGLGQQIETRISDGFSALQPQEVQSAVIAGMGGALTLRILRDGKEVLDWISELILQPQSEVPRVRRFLQENGWQIAQEDLVFEEEQYYPMMRAVHAAGGRTQMSPAQLAFGPDLLERRCPVLKTFLKREQKKQEDILTALEAGKNETAIERRGEVREYLQLISQALQLYQEA